MGEPVEQGRGHFGVAEHLTPFREAQIGSDDDAGPLIKFAQEVEQQGAARGAERQVAMELVADSRCGCRVGGGIGQCVAALRSTQQNAFLNDQRGLAPDRCLDCVAGLCSNRPKTVLRKVFPQSFQR